jgi:lipopolysaccharide export system permease protein
MNGLTRYILRQLLGTTSFVTAALCAAIWLAQALRLVDLIVNRGLSVQLFLYLAVLILPRLVEIILPIGVFIAVLFTYNRLITESELVVMRSAGVSQFGLTKPALLLGATAIVVLFALSAYLLPAANRDFKDLQFQIRNKFVSAVLQEGTFTAISDTMTVYVRERDVNGDLTGFLIQDERERAKPVTIVAERGAFVETVEGPRILLANGIRQQYERATGKLSSLTFETYTLELNDEHGAAEARLREPQELFLDELLFPDPQLFVKDPNLRTAYLVEAHQRLISPLTAMTLALIPLACLLSGQFNRRGQARRAILAVIFAFLLEAGDVGLRNLAGRYIEAVPLMYANVLLPTLLCGWILFRSGARRAMRVPGFARASA